MLYDDFVRCVNHFLSVSDRINDGWKLETHEGNVYLVKKVVQIVENDDGETDSGDDLPIDGQTADVPRLSARKWEYHVLYNHSYGVPVLYFNVWNPSGELLTLDSLWRGINPNFRTQILANKWFALTQQEHPYLLRPFFYFHPCDTSRFIQSFYNKGSNVLITWMSSIGQIIWLEMDYLYGKLNSFSEEDDEKENVEH